MKRYLLISIACFVVAAYAFSMMGCMSANQLAAEKAFYEAKVAMTRQAQAQPIFEILASDLKQPIILQNVSAIRVFQVPAGGSNDEFRQYIQKDYAQPYLTLTGQLLSIGLPWFGAYKMVEAVARIPRTNTTSITTMGDGNKTAIGDLNLDASGNTGSLTFGGPMGLLNDQTSTPTVVHPKVVDPLVVNPVVVPPSYPPEPAVP